MDLEKVRLRRRVKELEDELRHVRGHAENMAEKAKGEAWRTWRAIVGCADRGLNKEHEE